MLIWNIEEVQAIDYFKEKFVQNKQWSNLLYSTIVWSNCPRSIYERLSDTAEKSCYSRKSMYKIIEVW